MESKTIERKCLFVDPLEKGSKTNWKDNLNKVAIGIVEWFACINEAERVLIQQADTDTLISYISVKWETY
jgi:hypothetical protein